MQELSTHLLKNMPSLNPLLVHEVAGQYATAQLLMSRKLCLNIGHMLHITRSEEEDGFTLMYVTKHLSSVIFIHVKKQRWTTHQFF